MFLKSFQHKLKIIPYIHLKKKRHSQMCICIDIRFVYKYFLVYFLVYKYFLAYIYINKVATNRESYVEKLQYVNYSKDVTMFQGLSE